jgi:UDP-glucose 4-epimerase
LILITGANGFIGNNLCVAVAQSDRIVVAATRHSLPNITPYIKNVQISSLNAHTNWHHCLHACDVVVHLAARVHVMRDAVADPLADFRMVNVDGTLNLARQAAKAGVRRFVYLSSIKVNGEQTPPSQPFTEKSTVAPIDFYGISKSEAEEGLFELSHQTGMEIVVIRPPLVYGPGAKANFLNMMCWLHKGVPLPFASINNRRSLVALDNLIDFIVVCLEHPEAANQTFLVSDGDDLSTTELLRRMAQELGKPARLVPIPAYLLEAVAALLGRRDMAQRLCGSLQIDISKAKKMLGWNPPISVDEGLRRTAQGFLHEKTV